VTKTPSLAAAAQFPAATSTRSSGCAGAVAGAGTGAGAGAGADFATLLSALDAPPAYAVPSPEAASQAQPADPAKSETDAAASPAADLMSTAAMVSWPPDLQSLSMQPSEALAAGSVAQLMQATQTTQATQATQAQTQAHATDAAQATQPAHAMRATLPTPTLDRTEAPHTQPPEALPRPADTTPAPNDPTHGARSRDADTAAPAVPRSRDRASEAPAPASAAGTGAAAITSPRESRDRSTGDACAGTAPQQPAPATTEGPVSHLAPPPLHPALSAAPHTPSTALPVYTIAAPLATPEFTPALAAQVTVLAREGAQQAELRLNPADMGPIVVRIEVADGALATVHFAADVAGTRDALEASLPELAGALREAGLTLVGGGVSQHAPQSQHGARGDAGAGAPARGEHEREGGAAAADLAASADATPLRRMRGVVDLVA
jgi:flagellar hook-length control protein FliK